MNSVPHKDPLADQAEGTYYYILEYQDTAEQTHTKKGWLYLKY